MLASTVNPFATGVASDAAGISISDGLGLRLLMWIVLVPVAIGYVLLVRQPGAQGPLALAARRAEARRRWTRGGGEVPAAHRPQKITLVIFFGAFATMIYGFIPWDDVWDNLFDADFPLPTFGNFYFTEASMLFLVARRGRSG